jgi:hypothetical protein
MSVTRLLLLLLLLLLSCCVHVSVQQAAVSSSAVKDCNKEKGALVCRCFVCVRVGCFSPKTLTLSRQTRAAPTARARVTAFVVVREEFFFFFPKDFFSF